MRSIVLILRIVFSFRIEKFWRRPYALSRLTVFEHCRLPGRHPTQDVQYIPFPLMQRRTEMEPRGQTPRPLTRAHTGDEGSDPTQIRRIGLQAVKAIAASNMAALSQLGKPSPRHKTKVSAYRGSRPSAMARL